MLEPLRKSALILYPKSSVYQISTLSLWFIYCEDQSTPVIRLERKGFQGLALDQGKWTGNLQRRAKLLQVSPFYLIISLLISLLTLLICLLTLIDQICVFLFLTNAALQFH